MIIGKNNIISEFFGGFFFSFASKCMPTFFSMFLSTKGYSTRDIILISSIFFLGSLTVKNNFFKNKISVKVFQIAAAIGSIILHIQGHVHMVWGWFLIRFIQGIIDILCRNALNNLTHDKHLMYLTFFMNFGSSMGFLLLCYPKVFPLLFMITGVLLNLSHIFVTLHRDSVENNQITYIQQDKVLNNWYRVLRENNILFIAFILSTLLTSTFSTILPITLRNNGFNSHNILIIMFIGSLGHTFIHILSVYLRNIIGNMLYIKTLLILLFILYGILLFSINFFKYLTPFCIFFIVGFHNGITSVLVGVLREILNVNIRFIRHGVNQVTHICSILSSIISLLLLTSFPRYGLFILWTISLIFITIIVRSIKDNNNNKKAIEYV